MRTLVIGATGYVGSRVIPRLLADGHDVIAGARDPNDLEPFSWHTQVSSVAIDVLDATSVHDALEDENPDTIVYLVHGMGGDDFQQADRAAALHVRKAADAHAVKRIVYVSGIIPPISEADLSEHLSSRLEVERLLSESSATVITLRAAMVLGAGSTSFELMAQLANRLPVTVVPDWMQTTVEPIAVVDLVSAISGALTASIPTQHLDVGGGETLPYPELIERYTTAAGLERPQITVPLLPEPVVAKIASWIADVPSSTVVALMESLQEDMVASDHVWRGILLSEDQPTVSVDEAVRRSLAEPSDDPMTLQPGDPDWASATTVDPG